MSYEGHPPFSHNPHVYEGVDPDGNQTEGLVVHSTIAAAEQASGVWPGENGPEMVIVPDGPSPIEPGAGTAVTPADSDDADTDVDGDGQVTGYEVFTKADLIAHIEGLNKDRAEGEQISTAGNKPDLVKRIQDAEAAQGGE